MENRAHRSRCIDLQVGVVLVGQGLLCGGLHLLAVLLHLLVIDLDLRGGKGGSGNEFLCDGQQGQRSIIKAKSRGTHQLGVANQLPRKPEEGLLEVVVGLGGDIVVLEVLLAVEGDGLGLDLTLLHIDLVTAKHDGDVLADTDEVTFSDD